MRVELVIAEPERVDDVGFFIVRGTFAERGGG